MRLPRLDIAHDGRASQPERFGLLFVFLLATFWLLGVAPEGDSKRVFVIALLGGTLLLALWSAEMPARRLRAAAAAVGIWVAAVVIAALAGSGDAVDAATAAAAGVLVAFAPPAVIVGITRGLRRRREVTLAEVLGVLCLYLLVGMLFAFVYRAVDDIGSGAFFTNGVEATLARCLYYSFTTMTTVGYGDLTARTNFGHTLSATEALIGQIYLVTIVAVIVSNLRPGGRGPR
jgi:Ion channel